MRRNVGIIALALFLTLIVCPIAIASDILTDPSKYSDIVQGKIDDDTTIKDEGSWPEKILTLPIDGLTWAISKIGIKGLDELIFNAGESASMVIPPWINDEAWGKVEKWFLGFQTASAGLILLAIVINGIKLTASSFNARKREEAMGSFMRWIYAIIIIVGAPLIIDLLLQINNYAVHLCYNLADSMGAFDHKWTAGLSSGDMYTGTIVTGSILGTAVVKLGLAGLSLYFNILYVVRSFVLVGLYALTPILVWLWAINNNEDAIKVWFGEVTSVCFMQFSHAFALCFFITIIGSMGDVSWWIPIVGLVAIIPFSAMIRNIFQGFWKYLGVNEEAVAGKAMGMVGGALMLGKMSASKNLGVNTSGAPTGSGNSEAGPYGVTHGPDNSVSISGTLPAAARTANVLGGNVAGAESYLGKAGATVFRGAAALGGIAAGAALAPVSPAAAIAVGRGVQGAISMGGRAVGMGTVVGGGVAKSMLGFNESGERMGVGDALKDAATVRMLPNGPQGTLNFEGMDRLTPGSTKEAAAQLIGGMGNKVLRNQSSLQGLEAASQVLKEEQQLVDKVQASKPYQALKSNITNIDNLFKYK